MSARAGLLFATRGGVLLMQPSANAGLLLCRSEWRLGLHSSLDVEDVPVLAPNDSGANAIVRFCCEGAPSLHVGRGEKVGLLFCRTTGGPVRNCVFGAVDLLLFAGLPKSSGVLELSGLLGPSVLRVSPGPCIPGLPAAGGLMPPS